VTIVSGTASRILGRDRRSSVETGRWNSTSKTRAPSGLPSSRSNNLAFFGPMPGSEPAGANSGSRRDGRMGAYSKMGIPPEAFASSPGDAGRRIEAPINARRDRGGAGRIGATKPPGCSGRLPSRFKPQPHFGGDLAALANDFSALRPRLAATCIWRDSDRMIAHSAPGSAADQFAKGLPYLAVESCRYWMSASRL